MPDPVRRDSGASCLRTFTLWALVLVVMAVPILLATTSPYLQYRNPAYIIAGFAGILCLSLFLLQPLLAAGYLPGIDRLRLRRWHRITGTLILICVLLHIGGLYFTSPPDTLDALLLVSPTPFSIYGVLATVGLLLTALLVATRRTGWLRYPIWRLLHNLLALGLVLSTVIHALQIEGTMEPMSKWGLCGIVVLVTTATLIDQRLLRPFRRKAT